MNLKLKNHILSPTGSEEGIVARKGHEVGNDTEGGAGVGLTLKGPGRGLKKGKTRESQRR